MEAARLLDSTLKKKWLSSNAVRDGMIACFTLTLFNYAKQAPLSRLGLEAGGDEEAAPDETEVYRMVLQATRDSFDALHIDDEYPTKNQLLKLKAIMEERLCFSKLNSDNPALMDEYRRLTNTLLAKME